MTTFQKHDQDQEEQQEQQQEQHQRSSDTEKKEVICTTTTNNNKNKNKNKSNRNNNNNEILLFEEKTYVGDVDDDNVRVIVEEVGLQQAEAEVTEDVVVKVKVETEVPLHIAVRQCWPKLFPTKSGSKKYIRKGLFTVAVGRLHHQKAQTYYQKGKCDTKIKIGDIIRRKIQKGEQQQQKQQKGGGQDDIQPHFRNRGTSTSEIIQRAIGGKLCIAYLDQYIAVVIKPYGMPVNKVNVNNNKQSNQQQQKVISMHELLLHCMPQQTQTNTHTPHSSDDDVGPLLRRPACIHRLDQVTYGLIIVALTSSSARYLSKQFECSYKTEEKVLQKRYRAIVYGHIINVDNNNDKLGCSYFIKIPLGGKECITEYRIVRHLIMPSAAAAAAATISNAESSSSEESSTTTTTPPITTHTPKPIPIIQLTLVDLFPHTGRTHQLRKHMEYIGHPIVGDMKYNDLNKNGIHTNNNSKSKSKRRIDKISSDDDNGGIISYLKEEKEEKVVSASASSSSIVDDIDVVGDVTATTATATAAHSESKITKETIVMMNNGQQQQQQQQHQIPPPSSPPSLSLSYYTPLMLAAIELQFLHPKFASEALEEESSTAATATATATSEYNNTSTISTANATATATADHNSTTTTPTTTTNDGVSIASASGSGGGVATATTSASISASDYHVFAEDSETYIDRSKGTLKVKIDMPIEMKQLILRSL